MPIYTENGGIATMICPFLTLTLIFFVEFVRIGMMDVISFRVSYLALTVLPVGLMHTKSDSLSDGWLRKKAMG